MLLKRFKNSRVATNAGWIIACKLCKAVLTLVSTMIVSRYLGVEGYGIINYAASLVSFVTPIMKLGLSEILVHEIVCNPEDEGKTLGTTIVLNLISSFLCVAGIVGFVCIVNANERDTILVTLCYSLLLVFQAMEMVYYWFQAKLKSKYTSIAILVAYIVVVAVQLGLTVCRAPIYFIALSYSIEYLIIALVLIFFYKKDGVHKLSFSARQAKVLLHKGKYYIISSLMVMVFSQTDKIMLKLMCSDATVGIYSAAITCASMTSFVFVAIIDSIRPTIFDAERDSLDFEKKMTSLYSVIIWFSLVQCVIITLAAPIIILVMYGTEYSAATNILRLSVWFTTFSYIGTVRNIWILSYGYQRYLNWINISGAVVNVLLNFLLIPVYGAMGAASASVFAQFFTNFILGYLIPDLRPNNRIICKAMNPKYVVNMLRGS